MMMNIYQYRQAIVCWLFLPLLLMFLHTSTTALALLQDEVRVSSIDWKVVGDVIIITYDLTGSAEQTYEVIVVLLREKEPSFRVIPQTVQGDVGKGNFAGRGREIRWEYKKDLPEGLQGEDFYFEVNVQPAGGGSTLIYVAIGAAAVVGGAFALLGGKKSEAGPGTTTELPTPPLRP